MSSAGIGSNTVKVNQVVKYKDLEIRIFNEYTDIEGVKADWDLLAQSSGAYLPWRCYDWYRLCERFNRDGTTFRAFAIYRDNHLIGIVPTWTSVEKYKGLCSARVVRLANTHHFTIETVLFGDQTDLLSITDAFFHAVSSCGIRWDVIDFDRVQEENGLANCIVDSATKVKLRERTIVSCVNWYTDGITCPAKTFLDDLPTSVKKDVQYCRRRLEREGTLDFLVVTDVETIEKYLDLYDSVRMKSWKSSEKDRLFLRDFTLMAARKGWLRLGLLFYNNTPIAAQKWLVCKEYAHIHDVLYDEDYKKYSPGKILSHMMFEQCIDIDNVSTIDYLQGDEHYKKEWTKKMRVRNSIVIYNSTLKGLLYYYIIVKIKPHFVRHKHI